MRKMRVELGDTAGRTGFTGVTMTRPCGLTVCQVWDGRGIGMRTSEPMLCALDGYREDCGEASSHGAGVESGDKARGHQGRGCAGRKALIGPLVLVVGAEGAAESDSA